MIFSQKHPGRIRGALLNLMHLLVMYLKDILDM